MDFVNINNGRATFSIKGFALDKSKGEKRLFWEQISWEVKPLRVFNHKNTKCTALHWCAQIIGSEFSFWRQMTQPYPMSTHIMQFPRMPETLKHSVYMNPYKWRWDDGLCTEYAQRVQWMNHRWYLSTSENHRTPHHAPLSQSKTPLTQPINGWNSHEPHWLTLISYIVSPLSRKSGLVCLQLLLHS